MPKTATLDLEDLFAEELAAAESEDYDALVVGSLKLFPDEDPFRIIESDNQFNMVRTFGGDNGGFLDLLKGYIHPDDWTRLSTKLSSMRTVPTEKLITLLNKAVEMAAARPTEPPSPSPRSRTSATTVKS
jgi:hypothetical protein